MLLVLGLCVLGITDGSTGPLDKLEHYTARSMEYVEPQAIKHRKIDERCPMFCKNWRTPFYAKKVGGCVKLDNSSNMNDVTIAVGDYMFCPDIETIKCWTTEDELECRAFFQKLGYLEDSEYEVLNETKKQHELRFSTHPLRSTGPITSDDDFRNLHDDGAIRRRGDFTGSASSFNCFGEGHGQWTADFNLRKRPYKIVISHGEFINQIKVTYKNSWYNDMSLAAGNGGGTVETMTPGCIDLVFIRSGSWLDSVRFRVEGRHYSKWYGGRGGSLHSITAPQGRCLGDIRMVSETYVMKLCLKFNAYKCSKYCGTGYRVNCDAWGREKPSCSYCSGCPSNHYRYRHCTQSSNVGCGLCRSCRYYEYETRSCSINYDRICSHCRTCPSNHYIQQSCHGNRNTVCYRCNTCSSNEYETRSCTTSSNRRCSKCTTCTSNQYESRACSRTQNRVCSVCRTCNSDQYESRRCSGTQNRACLTCRTCNWNEYESRGCSGTENRVCSPCKTCRTGEYILEECSATKDTVCAPCQTCGHGEYISKPCNSLRTDDTVCSTCDTCRPGTYLSTPCFGAQNAICSPCKVCCLGHIISTNCSGTQDTVCHIE